MVSGRHIFSVRLFHGTHTGPFKGPMGEIPATSKPVGLMVLHHVELNDQDLVAREWWSIDVPTMLSQLGLSKDPARPVITQGWPGAPTVLISKDDAVEQKNIGLVKSSYALFNKRDKGFADTIADDIVESTNADPADLVGKKALEEHNKMLLGAFSDMHIDVDNVWAAGDYTIAVEHARGTHDGDLGPVKKTGKSVDVTIVEVIKWKDGKAVATWPFMNGLELATQLGLVPPPPSK
jgi:predicted ester cyclase